MKKFTKFEITAIKRTAQSVSPMVAKKARLREQINALQAEYDNLEAIQEQYEAPIRTMTGGYSTEDLVDKVVETTNSVDKNGKLIKVTKFVLKYPETIVPVVVVDEVKEDSNVEGPSDSEDASYTKDMCEDMEATPESPEF